MALTIHTGMVQIKAGMARVARWLCKCNAGSQPGYYFGPVDGVIGSGTRRAIRAYEGSHGLPADGAIPSAITHDDGPSVITQKIIDRCC
jgi:lysozyme family protein